MIEVGAAEITEADMVAAIRFGLEHGIKPILAMIDELRAKCGAPAVRMGDRILPSADVMAPVKEKAPLAIGPLKVITKVFSRRASRGPI